MLTELTCCRFGLHSFAARIDVDACGSAHAAHVVRSEHIVPRHTIGTFLSAILLHGAGLFPEALGGAILSAVGTDSIG